MIGVDASEIEQMRSALDEATRQHAHDRVTIAGLQGQLDRRHRETQHRVRNILSVVRSIARRTAEEGETIEDYQARLDSRLGSFTRLQSHILRDAPGGVDLHGLIADELLAFDIRLGDRARLDGVDVRLHPKSASVLGLAFHELACLAITGRHLPGSDARIDVCWRTGADELVIEWTDSQRAGDAASRSDAAFGREFLEEAVSYELGGDVALDTADGDLTCRFRVPIAGHVVA